MMLFHYSIVIFIITIYSIVCYANIASQQISTQSCHGNLIIGGATGYSFREIRTFLLSYNISQTSSHSQLLLLFDIKQQYHYHVIDFIHSLKLPNIIIKYITIDKNIIFNSFRYTWLKNYLLDEYHKNHHRYCHVLSTDVRDVYFQSTNYFHDVEVYKSMNGIIHGLTTDEIRALSHYRPRLQSIEEIISSSSKYRGIQVNELMSQYNKTMTSDNRFYYEKHQLLPEKEWIILSQEGIEGGKQLKTCIHHMSAATLPCMKPVIEDFSKLMNNNIICSGSIVGSHYGVIKLLDVLLSNMNRVESSCLLQPMTDQMLLNIVIYEQLLVNKKNEQDSMSIHIPDNYYSPMMTMGYIPPEYYDITHDKTITTEKSDLGIAKISIDKKWYKTTSTTSRTRIVASYVHQYDRFVDIMKDINYGLGCGKGQYYGDKGEFMSRPEYPKKKKNN